MSSRAHIRRICARAQLALLAALGAALLCAPGAGAAFGLSEVEVSFADADGGDERRAGSHPFEQRISFEVNQQEIEGEEVVDGAIRDLDIVAPPGLVGDREAVKRCATADFLTAGPGERPDCEDDTAVGKLTVTLRDALEIEEAVPLHNLFPSPGVAAKLGFWIGGVPITVDLGVRPTPPYNIVGSLRDTSQVLEVTASEAILWGSPSDPRHDSQRGRCAHNDIAGECDAELEPRPFLTLPRSCGEELVTGFEATSWWTGDPGDPGPPGRFETVVASPAMNECSALELLAELGARPTTRAAESPTGMDVELEFEDEGIADPDGIAGSDIQKAVLTLPEGMTANPSLAGGLQACSEAGLEREAIGSGPGEGCPQAAKIGSVEAQTPVLAGETLRGELFVATPYENPFDSLIALYMVIRDRELGVMFKLAGEVAPDPKTGQLVVSFDDLPPYPVSHVKVHLREGARSPLISPPRCGTHTVQARLTPSARPAEPLALSSSFEIQSGPGGAPCPPGAQPFEPGFSAGSLSNAAGAHSPVLMRLTRRDGDADLTRFDAELPPGLVAKLAGVPWCPEAAIAAARAKSGEAEQASPSCPAASRIGSLRGGAGVGSQLIYVPGSLYLAGPTRGAPLSIVAIVPAVAGPFDVGTIVVRQALDLDPVSATARVEGGASDPIPHILAGIPLRVRDIQVAVDRPAFALNPTSCSPMAVLAGIWGGGADPFSAADDSPVLRSAPFQAAGCAALGFEPRLGIKLKGGTKRGKFPALRAHYRPRAGDANLGRLALTFPTSAFIEQGHFRTICTRVQFAAGSGHGSLCPQGSRYGTARVWSPLIDGPLRGPVYLRSSDNNLPDAVFALTGPPSAAVQIEVAVRIDSVKGRLRATVESAPDAPVSRAIVDMQGGQKGLFVNSRHLCVKPKRNRVRANLKGQNGRNQLTKPRVISVACVKRRKAKRSSHRRARIARASAAG